MGVKQKISVSLDLTLPVLPAPMISLHKYVCIPPNPAVPYAGHLDCMVNIFWPPGYGLGQNKLASSVRHASQMIAQESHDCGVCIPHMNIAPPAPVNVLLAIHIPFSKRAMCFSASTVKMQGSAVGTSDLLSIPTPMMVCENPISLPVGFPVTNACNTVNVGMTAWDFVAGFVAIAVSMAADFFLRGKLEEPKVDIWKKIADKLFWKDLKSFAIKAFASIVTGVVKIWATGEGGISIGVGSPFGGIKIGVSAKKDGSVVVSVELTVLGAKGKGQVGSDGKGVVSGEQPLIGKKKISVGGGEHPAAGKSALIGGEEPL